MVAVERLAVKRAHKVFTARTSGDGTAADVHFQDPTRFAWLALNRQLEQIRALPVRFVWDTRWTEVTQMFPMFQIRRSVELNYFFTASETTITQRLVGWCQNTLGSRKSASPRSITGLSAYFVHVRPRSLL